MPRPLAHLANLDLNLLVALRERSVTRAAERMGVTQPAASAALSRLRRHFGDELLVRDRGEYTLTALGAQLAEQADAVCTAAERLFAAGADFDPATSEREFTLVMADYTIVVMGEALSQVIARAAPRARLHIRLVRETLLDIRPRIAVRVESYLAVPHFVAGTDRIALMQERLAARLADRMDLRVLECPGQPEPITEALWWHRQYEDDIAHAWLRRLIVETARRL